MDNIREVIISYDREKIKELYRNIRTLELNDENIKTLVGVVVDCRSVSIESNVEIGKIWDEQPVVTSPETNKLYQRALHLQVVSDRADFISDMIMMRLGEELLKEKYDEIFTIVEEKLEQTYPSSYVSKMRFH